MKVARRLGSGLPAMAEATAKDVHGDDVLAVVCVYGWGLFYIQRWLRVCPSWTENVSVR